MAMMEYVEKIAIPALNEEKTLGYWRSSLAIGWDYDPLKVAKAIEERTNYKCTPCGGTVYIKL